MKPFRAARPLVVAILLACVLGGFGSGDRLHAQTADVRTVTMRLAPDETYRAQPNWEATLRQTVQAVSDIYERQFQIRFVIVDIVPWTSGASGGAGQPPERPLPNVPIGNADVLVGFMNRCARLTYGWARAFNRVATVTTGCYETVTLKDALPDQVLSHELAHLFGGFHPPITVKSVMRMGPADAFDDQTSRVIRLMRAFDFKRGVLSVDPDTRRAWSAIYAEGHARDEPNPLATAISSAAWDLIRSGRVGEGEAALHEAVKVDPSSPAPHLFLGRLYSRRGQLPQAVQELRAAKDLDFRQVEARLELGHVLRRLGKDEDALWEFREVLRVDPRLAPAHMGLGMVLERQGKSDDAIRAYGEAIRIEPDAPAAYFGRGAAYARKGEHDRAIQDYDQAIRLRPRDPMYWNNRCFTRALAGRLEPALADCNEALRLRPDYAAALDSRGLAYLKLDQIDRAIADYDAALRLDPKLAASLYGRGLAKRRKGDEAGAEADLAAATALSPRIAEEYGGYGLRP